MLTSANLPKPISDRSSPAIRRVRNLQNRAARERTGLFFIEGLRFVAQAMHHRVPIETLVVAPKLLIHPFGQKLVRLQRSAGTPYLAITPELFSSISQAEDAQGIGAIVRQRWDPLAQVDPSAGLCWLALETVHAPGNIGSILRTGEAVGAAGVILIGDSVDPYHPAAVRASMGSLFAQRLVRTTLPEFLAWKLQHGCTLVGTSPAAAADYHAVAYRPPTVLFMGGEKQGLPEEYQQLCDLMVKIPMVGRCDSLNLAVATGVMLYEIFNQRRAGPAKAESIILPIGDLP